MEHIPRLDGFRGLAIVLVIVGHVLLFSFGSGGGGLLAGLGVLLFFVLSGFLITLLLLREFDATGTINLRAFYLRRAFRILPAALVFLSVVTVLMITGWITDVTWGALVASLLFFRNIRGSGDSLGHMWSLSLEEQFYAGWPLAMSLLTPRRALTAASLVIAACAVWRGWAIFAGLYPYQGGTYYLRTDFRVDSILIGCWVALALARPRLKELLTWTCGRIPIAIIALLLFCWSLEGERIIVLRPVFLTLQTLLSALLFVRIFLLPEGAPTVRILNHSFMRWLGRISYSLYLWQQILLAQRTPSWGIIREFPLNIAATFAAALLSYYLVEQPALRAKMKWTTRRAQQVTLAA